jgi:hypothetical protein
MIWNGARDHDDHAPGVTSDALCLLFAMLNAVGWPALAWLVFAP